MNVRAENLALHQFECCGEAIKRRRVVKSYPVPWP